MATENYYHLQFSISTQNIVQINLSQPPEVIRNLGHVLEFSRNFGSPFNLLEELSGELLDLAHVA